ncbi:hypothetical protein ACJJI3_03195 [Microbulbifer sp. ZKSA004]|uniref:hypothetical protein n=1 Tax=Microbulbifer sp. ZKSA004 TaxID=3243389 RepID=UPI00403A4D46
MTNLRISTGISQKKPSESLQRNKDERVVVKDRRLKFSRLIGYGLSYNNYSLRFPNAFKAVASQIQARNKSEKIPPTDAADKEIAEIMADCNTKQATGLNVIFKPILESRIRELEDNVGGLVNFNLAGKQITAQSVPTSKYKTVNPEQVSHLCSSSFAPCTPVVVFDKNGQCTLAHYLGIIVSRDGGLSTDILNIESGSEVFIVRRPGSKRNYVRASAIAKAIEKTGRNVNIIDLDNSATNVSVLLNTKNRTLLVYGTLG